MTHQPAFNDLSGGCITKSTDVSSQNSAILCQPILSFVYPVGGTCNYCSIADMNNVYIKEGKRGIVLPRQMIMSQR